MLNVISSYADEIRRISARNWNDIIKQMRQTGNAQLNVVWPLLDGELFGDQQRAFATLSNIFVLSMEWSKMSTKQVLAEKAFWGGHVAEHCAATKLAVNCDFGAAYDAFQQSGAPGLTPAAVSCYLHAISLNAGHEEMALPYDEDVVKALWKCQAAKNDQPALTIQKEWRQRLVANNLFDDSGQVTAVWNRAGYMEYLSFMKSWAETLNCQPVQIQIWLSKNSGEMSALPDDDIGAFIGQMDILGI